MTDESESLRESIELTNFLTTEQIEQIISRAVNEVRPGDYQAKVEIQFLMDELAKRGLKAENRFEAAGSEWTCPKCNRKLVGVGKCPCGHINPTVLPKGTYEFLYEADLGSPKGSCKNYGCGHPIRFEEHVRHLETGLEFVVGNVCVERILGEHDLVKVATSLLARISGRVDKLSKAAKCKAICGSVLQRVRELDPRGWFTEDEQRFLEAIEGAKSGLTLKKAEELRDKWTAERVSELEARVRARKGQEPRGEGKDRWLEFLHYKRQNRPQAKDFWDNCISAAEKDGAPTSGQRNALQAEYDRFWKIAGGDETVLEPLEGLAKWVARRMLKHSAKCRSYFHVGLLEQLLTGGRLTDGQLAALDQGCRMCRWTP